MSTLEFKPLRPEDEPLWDRFCETHSDAWFWHTTAYLKYQAAYRPAAKTRTAHFYAWRDGQIVAICPLARETHAAAGQAPGDVFSLGEDFLPAPVVADGAHPADRERLRKAVFQEIDTQAQASGIVKAAFREAPLTPQFLKPVVAPANPLVAYDYLDNSLQTQIVDLTASQDFLWSDVRKSYHSLILKAEKVLEFKSWDRTSITEAIFETYRELHHKAAGRVTRPMITFQMMLEWIRQGQAILTQLIKDNQVIACALINTYKNKAYYASACNDPEWENTFPLGHLIQWKTMLDLKRRRVTHYELGWQTTGPSLSYVPTPEEIQISRFKHAFGGVTLPFHRGTKYYSPDVFRQDYTERIQQIESFLRR